MKWLSFFLDIQHPLVIVLGCKMSFLELSGTAANLACVWLTAREKISCWPIGILGILLFLVMFYQLRLYSDMFLQVFFLATSFYGWYQWVHPKTHKQANANNQLRITALNSSSRLVWTGAAVLSAVLFGCIMARIHLWLPLFFPAPAAFPFADSFVAAGSIAATLLMTRKKIECWFFWIGVDLLALVIYFLKGILLVGIEYAVFAVLAGIGLWTWNASLKKRPALEQA